VDNYDTFYTYRGISANGRYYIAIVLPINSTLLSNQGLTQVQMETISVDSPGYITRIKDLLVEDNGAMTPLLAALDAMMMPLFSQD